MHLCDMLVTSHESCRCAPGGAIDGRRTGLRGSASASECLTVRNSGAHSPVLHEKKSPGAGHPAPGALKESVEGCGAGNRDAAKSRQAGHRVHGAARRRRDAEERSELRIRRIARRGRRPEPQTSTSPPMAPVSSVKHSRKRPLVHVSPGKSGSRQSALVVQPRKVASRRRARTVRRRRRPRHTSRCRAARACRSSHRIVRCGRPARAAASAAGTLAVDGARGAGVAAADAPSAAADRTGRSRRIGAIGVVVAGLCGAVVAGVTEALEAVKPRARAVRAAGRKRPRLCARAQIERDRSGCRCCRPDRVGSRELTLPNSGLLPLIGARIADVRAAVARAARCSCGQGSSAVGPVCTRESKLTLACEVPASTSTVPVTLAAISLVTHTETPPAESGSGAPK